ncbi:ASCH domain-containing protein [Anaerobacillus alkaliphilus]|uniref:ASCH domain-containing protein n=1 Tax=Anaerobacillus alkaliphilus TaxID=1548597 RepID=A0A4Q0VUZ2_9BACI|nr:ASCH domain-containing protein [Anaerobacillus alkaliphilus]RXJ02610.1 ASCH domain-containing protein [Anaerobacillus alkaliphilus]
MNLHTMGLFKEPFISIKEGRKTVEVRLNDEKRRKVNVGDLIEFILVPEDNETLKVEVLGVTVFATFQEMYESIPFEKFNCEGWTMDEMLNGTYEIYSKEQEEHWGTLAITIKKL